MIILMNQRNSPGNNFSKLYNSVTTIYWDVSKWLSCLKILNVANELENSLSSKAVLQMQ